MKSMKALRLLYILPLLPLLFAMLALGYIVHSAIQGFLKGWHLADEY